MNYRVHMLYWNSDRWHYKSIWKKWASVLGQPLQKNLGKTSKKIKSIFKNPQKNQELWRNRKQILKKIWYNFQDISGNSKSDFWKFLEKFRENCEKIARNFLKLLEEFKKIMIFGDFSISFKITSKRYYKNFKENSWEFWNTSEELFEVLWWSCGKIARKFWKKLKKI